MTKSCTCHQTPTPSYSQIGKPKESSVIGEILALAALHAVHFLLASKELHVSQSQFLGNLEVHGPLDRADCRRRRACFGCTVKP